MNPEYISFDVFDTCLTRLVALPTDVFTLMAPDVAKLIGEAMSQRWREDFVWARVRGESLARERNSSGEVDLASIWPIVKEILNLPEYDYEGLELYWEERVSVAIPKAKSEIQAARAARAKIIFVSDMYLPSSFIHKLLVKHGFLQQGDHLFVSSDFNATKSSGKLFQLISENLGVKSNQILHYGDNKLSDYDSAIAAGWNAKLVNWTKLTPIEMRLRQCQVLDMAKSTRLVAAMRSTRLSESNSSGNLRSQFVTPFLQVFVDWVLNSAEEDGVKRLYFLGRDCQLAWKFASHNSLNRASLDCRYLHASRRSYYPATIGKVSPKGIPWLCQPWEKPILSRLLSKLGVSMEQFSYEWAKSFPAQSVPASLEIETDWKKFWQVIQQHSITNNIQSFAASKRAKLLDYLTQEGLMDGVKCAFVDIGWTYGIQRAAEIVLSESGSKVPLCGYYLGSNFEKWEKLKAKSLFPPSIPGAIAGPYAGEPNGMANFLEHILGYATHGSLADFKYEGSRIVPVFDMEHIDSNFQFPKLHQNEALEHLGHFSDLKGLFGDDLDARAALVNLLRDTYEYPPYEVAEGARGIVVSSDANGHGAISMVVPYTWKEFFKSLLRHFKKSAPPAERRREWIAGSLAVTPRMIRGLARRLGILDTLTSM